jgi:hypothetical protein
MARKEKTIHYIYKTTCNITGRWYIGMHSTNNLEDGYMGSGKILRHSIRKYGVENHTKEILEYLPSREELILREQKIVNKELIGDGKCMNLREGGGGFGDAEHQLKCSKAGNEAFLKRFKTDKSLRIETSERMSFIMRKKHANNELKYDNFKGEKHLDETKQKMSESSKCTGVGETNSQYGTCWITKDNVNKKIKKEDFETYLNEGWVKGRS